MLVLPLEVEVAGLRSFEKQIREAHKAHLRTGDYALLGMAAQDALLELDKTLSHTSPSGLISSPPGRAGGEASFQDRTPDVPDPASEPEELTCDECGAPATHYGDGHYCANCARTLAEADEEMSHEAQAQAREP